MSSDTTARHSTPNSPRSQAVGEEALEQAAKELAQRHLVTDQPQKTAQLLRRLPEQRTLLDEAYQRFVGIDDAEASVSYATEWFLDNFYLLQRAHRLVVNDLPQEYYEELPKLGSGPLAGYPRAYALARSLIAVQVFQLEPEGIRRFVHAYQTEQPLTMGELWALPLLLRLVLLREISLAAAKLTGLDIPEGLKSPETLSGIDLVASEIIANAIPSLLRLANEDWEKFFEEVSLVEQTLRQDPARAYPIQDFATRDAYRKVVEDLALYGSATELEVGRKTVALAREHTTPGWAKTDSDAEELDLFSVPRQAHVGYYLVGAGLTTLRRHLNYKPPLEERTRNWVLDHPTFTYLGAIGLVTTGLLLAILFYVSSVSSVGWLIALTTILALVPAVTIAVSFVNWLVTLAVPPRKLPKLDFTEGIPKGAPTFVVIPAMLSDHEGIRVLLRQLELHFLRNPDPQLSFALLTDFADAETETRPEDETLVETARGGIERLNEQYGGDRFFLFHRKRLWNEQEQAWMGWERKRGKLHEFNRLLRGADDTSYVVQVGDLGDLRETKFVITLDADTVLARGSARRLVGTLAHPLNRARFEPETGKVTDGYTVLQPRTEIKPASASQSLFTRVFAGESGLDLYTLAVSDVYQDLFGEGIYVGKGIYEVDAFERSLHGRVPENALLSHDLFEGIHGRAGLVTDIILYEDYPPHYLVRVQRSHRWIRGDWQLLPWLLPWVPRENGWEPNRLDVIGWWKIADNLRRSLIAPTLFLFLICAWTFLPGSPLIWTLFGVGAPGVSLLTAFVATLFRRRAKDTWTHALKELKDNALQWLFFLTFLPYEALLNAEATMTTIGRLVLTRRHLLEWTTSARTARLFDARAQPAVTWRQMISPVLSSALIATLILVADPRALLVAAPLLGLWALSPQIAYWISRPERDERVEPPATARRDLRTLARRTWLFYEHFVGPDDNWLPPDHLQESPKGVVAHRTSPTNTGLYLTSALAAYNLGYIGLLGLVLRLRSTFESMEKLERYRGHFLNWIDTRSLTSLNPRYVSTVDSGNLAASLIALAQGCRHATKNPVLQPARWQGFEDTLAMLQEAVATVDPQGEEDAHDRIVAYLDDLSRRIQERASSSDWISLFLDVEREVSQELDARLMQAVEELEGHVSAADLHEWRTHVDAIHLSISGMRRELEMLLPWSLHLNEASRPFDSDSLPESGQRAWQRLRDALDPYAPLSALPDVAADGEAALQDFHSELASLPAEENTSAALAWSRDMATLLEEGRLSAESVLIGYQELIRQMDAIVQEMDFSFLYDEKRKVFHIGYNLDVGRLDDNYYDLLASEARITSLLAIAKHDVPQSHWLHLARPVTEVSAGRTLLSWSGTMFEYLMPPLFLRRYRGTFLHESESNVVAEQIRYGEDHDVPWGISESGFYTFDAAMNYQYRAFGVPGLGFKRGLGEDLVVSPYASLLALCCDPNAVVRNLAALRKLGMHGRYGYYEAIDFTESRIPDGGDHAIVKSYMAHHQGMILLSLLNYLQNDRMVDFFHADQRVESVELLLQEQIPTAVPVEFPHAEEMEVVSPKPRAVAVHPWEVPAATPTPATHVLSNGQMRTMITNAGGGYAHWKDIALTRWRADVTRDCWGHWLYLQDEQRGVTWSVAPQPMATGPDGRRPDVEVKFYPHMAELRRRENDIVSRVEVAVSPDADVEIRRAELMNDSDEPRTLRVTSYAEVVLAEPIADQRHQAFAKLFVESSYVDHHDCLLFRRRPRAEDEESVFLAHTAFSQGEAAEFTTYETDRARFLGRGRTAHDPRALDSEVQWLSETVGATLDPVMALGKRLNLPPRGTVRLAFITCVGRQRDEVLDTVGEYRNWAKIERTFEASKTAAEQRLRRYELDSGMVENAERVLSLLLYPHTLLRAEGELIARNELGQSGLWGFGISGDYPILLLRMDKEEETVLLQELVRIHRYWRSGGIKVDLVILNRKEGGYSQDLQAKIRRQISQAGGEDSLNRRGGIFVLRSDQMSGAEKALVHAAARVILDVGDGSLAKQLDHLYDLPAWLPPLRPALPIEELEEYAPPLEPPQDLQFGNGLGGFSPDGKEYVIYLDGSKSTPAPWINVIANPQFGFLVSEGGMGYTWTINSGENRLSVWRNDPVSAVPPEALFLRDEETAQVWTPTPQPRSGGAPYQVRHGAGYTIFTHNSHGLGQRVRVFADSEEPIKVVELQLENMASRARRLTATYYVEWLLGATREMRQYLVPEYLDEQHALAMRNPYNQEFVGRVAFLASSEKPHGVTADRTEFIGRLGTLSDPAALRRMGLESRIEPGLDPCGAIQMHIDLAPGETKKVYFLVGQGADHEETVALLERFLAPEQVERSWRGVRGQWDEILNQVQVRTPEPAMDLLLNRWLLYQALACRVWGRSALYQSSGAYGFRDQLQDVMALVHSRPDVTREHILRSAMHQFEAGDVLHWWHPPSGRGVRTRIRDDLLWLPFVTAHYIKATGDESVLDEQVSFLVGEALEDDEHERYGQYDHTRESFTIFEHCLRALRRGMTKGRHGLPLMGTGDWNDGMNRVGEEGQGESVWLGWFLIETLNAFAPICERVGDSEDAEAFRAEAQRLGDAIEREAWDGDWYVRAFYDDGSPLGSSKNVECRIDAIAQSWGVLSGAAAPERARSAMASVEKKLVRPEDRLVLLLTPPFNKTPRDPGYIKGYLPGIRENGGQYTHAALWTIWAYAEMGEAEKAEALFRLINPILRADSEEKVEIYKVEPYVIAADVYGVEPHTGRGGWTWYTGSSGWMYRLGLEGILGVHREGKRLCIRPRIPPTWEGYGLRYRYGDSMYEIEVDNRGGDGRTVGRVTVDGERHADGAIPLQDDGELHIIKVELRDRS